jgi:peptide/nickel transport system permease protein
MLKFVARRFGLMVLTAICLTFIVFFLTNLRPNLEKLARTEGSVRMTEEAVDSWIIENGHGGSMIGRYAQWMGLMPGWVLTDDKGVTRGRCIDDGVAAEVAPRYCRILQGDWGFSSFFKKPVFTSVMEKLGATAWLMLAVMLVMVPASLLIGVISGMREGSRTDRALSTFAIASTATPEYVSGVVLVAIFASVTAGISPILTEWGWLGEGGFLGDRKTLFLGSATSALDGITFWNFALPVMTIALYGIGYIARMTRASMTEVMTQQYIRTARLKGVPFGNVVMKHALRNALIAPFTVIMLQFPWLLNGVVIVESLFNYKGFGWTLVQAASNNDIELLLGCSVVAVFVVLVTQLISDIGYVFLNPRIRLS